jgi:hypothetical protein
LNESIRGGRSNGLKWFVVQSKPREEERARYFLEEKGFDTYLPMMEVVSVRDFKNVTSEKPFSRDISSADSTRKMTPWPMLGGLEG